MVDVANFVGVMRPTQVALADAINRVIDELGTDRMALAEIVGVLDVVKMELVIEQRESVIDE